MYRYEINIILTVLFTCFINLSGYAQIDSVRFHYLGHSSFIVVLNNEISILTDYDKPNAYVDYGWNSPIGDIGNYQPDIVTYSHLHDDHYDFARIPLNTKYILTKPDT